MSPWVEAPRRQPQPPSEATISNLNAKLAATIGIIALVAPAAGAQAATTYKDSHARHLAVSSHAKFAKSVPSRAAVKFQSHSW